MESQTHDLIREYQIELMLSIHFTRTYQVFTKITGQDTWLPASPWIFTTEARAQAWIDKKGVAAC